MGSRQTCQQDHIRLGDEEEEINFDEAPWQSRDLHIKKRSSRTISLSLDVAIEMGLKLERLSEKTPPPPPERRPIKPKP
jgi:hypothetical protein